MKAGDTQSLFQLAVALNLGFSAIFAFGEPVRERAQTLSRDIEDKIISLSDNSNISDAQARILFEVTKSYMAVYPRIVSISRKSEWLQAISLRVVFVVCAIVAFIGLIVSSAVSDDTWGYLWILLPILLNVPVLVLGTAKSVELISLSSTLIQRLEQQAKRLELEFGPSFARARPLGA